CPVTVHVGQQDAVLCGNSAALEVLACMHRSGTVVAPPPQHSSPRPSPGIATRTAPCTLCSAPCCLLHCCSPPVLFREHGEQAPGCSRTMAAGRSPLPCSPAPPRPRCSGVVRSRYVPRWIGISPTSPLTRSLARCSSAKRSGKTTMPP